MLDVLLGEHLGLQYDTEWVPGLKWVEIDFPGVAKSRVLKIGANLLLRPQAEWLNAASMPKLPLGFLDVGGFVPRWEFGPVPVLFPPAATPNEEVNCEGPIFLPVDILGSVFFLLTRYEEIVVRERDRHERFSARNSVSHQAGILQRPLVDEYSRLLARALMACVPGLECRRHEPKIRLSHDIDHPYQFFRRSVGQIAYSAGKHFIKEPSLRKAWELASASARSGFGGDVGHDPFNSYESLMNAGERLGIPSEFYFMAGQRRRRYEEAYDLNKPELQQLLRRIHDRGHVIGLHAGYDSFRSVDALLRELEVLRSSANRAGIHLNSVGGRQHYLRWENPSTWRAWESAGLAYDATVGFADQIGFRCGTCREFPVFDACDSKKLKLRERPLALMDVTITDYLKLSPEQIAEQLRALWTVVRDLGGTMEVLIHNCNPQGPWLARQVCKLVDSAS
ncbi:MAG TPA: polysaccharide deacetylase family protein [Verrucomicrobiae bacterium]|nr:polysaccharide deacetylase family protein [Verrucomicrobiae bacterium]